MLLANERAANEVMSATNATGSRWLSIVGIGESGREGLCAAANRLIDSAALVVGGARHLSLVGGVSGEKLEWKSPFKNTIPLILARAGEPVCVLASGDPFWFGAGNVLAQHVPPAEMLVLPAPSTFSLAAARLGWALQSAVTLGLHNSRPEALLRHLHDKQKILALSLDGRTPSQVADLMTHYGFGRSIVHVFEALGGPNQHAHCAEATDIGSRCFSPLNIIAIEVKASPGARDIPFAPGLPDSYFEHDGQITKREIRAITISALRPAPGELLWDIGLGSGSVAVEWLLSHPSTRACGFERLSERALRAERNAISLGVPHLQIHEGSAPQSLSKAPIPDAIFVGGGVGQSGLMAAAWAALKPGGRIVANAVTFGGQAALFECRQRWGGWLTRICIEREHEIGRHKTWQPAMPVLQWAAAKS